MAAQLSIRWSTLLRRAPRRGSSPTGPLVEPSLFHAAIMGALGGMAASGLLAEASASSVRLAAELGCTVMAGEMAAGSPLRRKYLAGQERVMSIGGCCYGVRCSGASWSVWLALRLTLCRPEMVYSRVARCPCLHRAVEKSRDHETGDTGSCILDPIPFIDSHLTQH